MQAHPTPKPPSSQPAVAARKEPLQVRIPVTVKRRFKSEAALRGVDPNQLFVEVWSFWEAAQRADKDNR